MRFRDGTAGHKAIFATLLGVFLLSAGIHGRDTRASLGRPSLGWTMDGWHVSPMRRDAADAGLRGGGRLERLNGVSRTGKTFRQMMPVMHTAAGTENVLSLVRTGGEVREVTVRVRPRELRDVLFGQGALLGLGALAMATGLIGFVLRPYRADTWAVYISSTIAGSLLIHMPVNIDGAALEKAVLVRTLIGFTPPALLHLALALPVGHPALHHRAGILLSSYLGGAALAAYGVGAWLVDYQGVFQHLGTVDTGAMLLAMLFFIGRCFVHAVRPRDPLVAQRARILLAGTFFGGAPPLLTRFLQNTFGILVIDLRIVYWTLSIMLFAILYTTLRQHLLNARIAARRAVIYSTAMLALTGIALLLIAFRPYAVGLMLLPLLYFWPRFDSRVNAWLYPKRVQFGDLTRDIGEEMAACATEMDVLEILAHAPNRLCDATRAVAFLLPTGSEASSAVRHATANLPSLVQPDALVAEPLVQYLQSTRTNLVREAISVDPHFANIRAECYACFDRLGAVVLLPVVRANQVIGGLALGPRATEDVYEPPDLQALNAVTQQAVQALVRAEATARLREREREFADLKRFLSPQMIEQVMAKGGVAGLQTQRKLVTVLFCDLRGFTAFSDSVEPEEVLATLSEYHATMGRRITEFEGTLERFAGDGFMVFFNDPVEQPDHIARAVRMALAMRADVATLRAAWTQKGYDIDAGIGVHSGYATCGFVGYEGRRDYAVIGNVTNMAARLSDAAGGGEIFVSARVQSELANGVRAEAVGDLTLKGFHQPQPTYRILSAEPHV